MYVYIVHDACLFEYCVYAVYVRITFVFVVLCMYELLVFPDNFHLCCKMIIFDFAKGEVCQGTPRFVRVRGVIAVYWSIQIMANDVRGMWYADLH